MKRAWDRLTPRLPPGAEPPERLGRLPWFTLYRPRWVLRERQFTLHVYVVPHAGELAALDPRARREASGRGNPADAAFAVVLRRELALGEAVACWMKDDDFVWTLPEPQPWRGATLKFIVLGYAPATTHEGAGRALVRLLATADMGPEETLGEGDFDLDVVTEVPRGGLGPEVVVFSGLVGVAFAWSVVSLGGAPPAAYIAGWGGWAGS